MTIREVIVEVETEDGILRRHLLRLPLAEEAGKEEVMEAVLEEFARREADVHARQGRLPL